MLARHLLFLATRRPNAALPAVQQQQQQQTPNEPRHQSSLSHEDRQVHARASRIHSEPRERHQRFYTLPGWRVTKDVVTEPPRSLTPDAAVRLGAPSHTPVGLSALGYRFLASPGRDAPRNLGGFASSTPSCAQLQLPDRLGTGPAWSGSDSGRTTPTNPHLMLSPIKSTMSNEELFAAIHKSKRRLNIRDELEGTWLPPGCPPRLPGTRHSWSPESRDTPEVPRTVPPVSTTSRMDFKRLLLQQSIKSGPARISATEQLRLSRQQCLEGQRTPPRAHQPSQTPPAIAKVLSPRSGWRFHTPRTDVLSSTIIEDAAAEEKAMKPSPELPSPATEMPLPALVNTVRRQLRLTDERTEPVIDVAMEKQEKELENRLQAMRPNEEEDPIRAIEHRRMSNQLARARFLAEAPASDPPETHGRFTTTGRFRARSESPRQKIPSTSSDATTKLSSNIVTRCPSAPALETAL